MPEQGMVTEVSVDEQGSELTAVLTVGDALVYVEDVGVYDTSGGTIQVNGSRFDYDSADTDAGTLSIGGAGSPVAGDIGDVVSVIFGGEVAYDYTLLVMLSEGEPIYVPIAYGDRNLWPEGPVDPPIPVTVSDDLSTILDVPGRKPELSPDAVVAPLYIGVLTSPVSIPTGLAYQTVTGWFSTVQRGGMTYDPVLGRVRVPLDGYYAVSSSAAMFDSSTTTGRRAARPEFSTFIGTIDGGENNQDGVARRHTVPLVSPLKGLQEGEFVSFQVSQSSGSAMDLFGDAGGNSTFFCVEYRGPLN